MIKDFLINAAMLVSFISVIYQVFRNTGLNRFLPSRIKVGSGIIFGILGVVLIEFSIDLPNKLLIDFRYISILVAALCIGRIPALISGMVIILGRVILYELSEAMALGVLSVTLVTVSLCFITGLKTEIWKKWLYGVIITEPLSVIPYIVLLNEKKMVIEVLISYCSSFTLLSLLMYFYMGYNEMLTRTFIEYKSEARRDYLTGLNNVRQFDIMYNHVLREVKTGDRRLSLLYIDIDFFKRVNDTYGHKEGDNVLVEVGKILSRVCHNDDIVSRNGGEEFSVILVDSPPDKAYEIGERLKNAVSNTPIYLSNKNSINITISIGIASYPIPVDNLEIIREKADEALYEAKRSGRNKVVAAR